jgi:small-conductance mechanosensitive channel
MTFSQRAVEATVTGIVGVALTVVVRFVLRRGFDGYVARLEGRRSPAEIAGMRTRLAVLQRVIVALLVTIVIWSVFEVFPATDALARALLASGAVLALLAGLAFSAPLSNIGGGVLLALAQSVRLGDRISVADVTGTAEEITLIHTVLLTDDGRRVFVPNAQIVGSIVVNRSIDDPRRTVVVRLPIALRASVERARETLLAAAGGVAGGAPLDLTVALSDLSESIAWLTVTAHVAAEIDTVQLADELRESGLAALVREALLPA